MLNSADEPAAKVGNYVFEISKRFEGERRSHAVFPPLEAVVACFLTWRAAVTNLRILQEKFYQQTSEILCENKKLVPRRRFLA